MKISGIGFPAICSMSVSVSRNSTPRVAASARPTVVLPQPGAPTSTTTGAISG
jgi:hypothetical protein